MGSKTLGFIHTNFIMVDVLKKELGALPSDVRIFHIVDESLLIDFMRLGGLNPSIVKRLCQHAVNAEEGGADIMGVTCSSVSPAAEVARKLVSRPLLRIDEPMAEAAIEKGEKIGLMATVATALGPVSSLIEQKAAEKGKKVTLSTALCPEAFKALLQGDTESHDRMVTEKAVELARGVDLLVLAQGSMSRLTVPLGQKTGIPVLSSPRLFVEKMKLMIESEGG